MRTVDRDDFARMMQKEASKFPVGEQEAKFNNWSRASDELINVGEHFSPYKSLVQLPVDIRKIVVEAMQELDVARVE